jgi:hypothetical protein
MEVNSIRDDEILSHPIILHQVQYAKTILQHGKHIIESIVEMRPELSGVIATDIVIKLFRDFVCSALDCASCKQCSPGQFMDKKRLKKFLSENKNSILKKVQF